jgi:hypothetical protein
LKSLWKFKFLSESFDTQGPSDAEVALRPLASDGLQVSSATENALTLAALPVGARLILRCRKDWRDATVVAISPEAVTLSVGAPRGSTYRVRRPPDAPLSFEGEIPILGGEGCWRSGLARYDTRW